MEIFDPTNYRPISIISHVTKLLEKIIKSQIVGYLNMHQLISLQQSAFLQNHSTQTALHKMVDDWLTDMNEGCVSLAVCLDLSKCFDTITHEILIYKLHKYGFHGTVLNWMKSYFTDRVQCVRIDNNTSVFKPISLGIPQGSVLGPILFLLFINDLPDCVQDCTVCLFADDITLYNTCRDFNYVQNMVQKDLDNILHWFHQNRHFVNAYKSNCLFIQ